MNNRLGILTLMLLMLPLMVQAQIRKDGYYKDLFMDSGIMLTSRDDLPAARFLNLSWERLCTGEQSDQSRVTETDSVMQSQRIVGYDLDENGVLLYPDGAPRYRVIYVNGGKATAHGNSLTPRGIERIRQYCAAGGCYVGTCAGAFFASKGTTKDGNDKPNASYSGVWNGYTTSTGLEHSYTSLLVEKKSPLLRYYDFGGDMRIDSVRHNGGCYMPERADMPRGTEVLLRYDGDTLKLKNSIHKTVNAWAYKASDHSGRIVVTGSHPEAIDNGERLELFAAMLQYAIDGNGTPTLKGELIDTVARAMTRCTHDNDPAHTRIGDRQYHHFVVNVPKGAKAVTIDLSTIKGWDTYDLYLFASDKGFAFNDNSRYSNVARGANKKLVVTSPKPGKLYVSVYCDSTVETVDTPWGEQYTGMLNVLNGIPYTIKSTVTK